MADLKIQTFTGADVRPYLDVLADLRITVFREYPYLYDGGKYADYEREYIETYARSGGACFVLAFDGDSVVGASTGIPMEEAEADFSKPFLEAGWNPREIFYYGESVLLSAYRGQGVGSVFMRERENVARAGGFAWMTFCAVDRPPDHPQRPSGYRPLDAFWERHGFRQRPEIKARFEWKEVGTENEVDHSLTFWTKPLSG